MQQKIDQVFWMNPAELIPYANNAKIHPPEQIDRLANGIKAFGWTQPIVIDRNNVVVIGHGRLLAAKQLMLDKVPCVMRDDLNDQQINACRLEDNKTNESPWDFSKLEEELAQLKIDGIDMTQFGFEELDDFTDAQITVQEDSVPAIPEKAIAKRGDLWLLGEHRLMCGDSCDEDDIKKLMRGGQRKEECFSHHLRIRICESMRVARISLLVTSASLLQNTDRIPIISV